MQGPRGRSGTPAGTLILILSAALLTACGGGGGGDSADAGATSAWVKVLSACNEAPRIEVDTDAAPPTDLVVADICTGDGATVQQGGTVTAHYIGARLADAQVFDSSWDRNEPATFSLEQVIPGWTLGLPGMQEGGRRVLVIPGELGYGENPPGGYPAGTLIFVVDLEATQ
jgi:peptidylprolyl isomerase